MKYLLLVFMLLPITVWAQKKQGQARLDSLLAELPNATSDTNKVLLLVDISNSYIGINADEAMKNALQARELAISLGDERIIAYSNIAYAGGYLAQRKFEDALKYYLLALTNAQQLGLDEQIAAMNHNIGICYNGMGNIDGALEHLKKAKAAAARLNDKEMIAVCDLSIARAYLLLAFQHLEKKEKKKATKYFIETMNLTIPAVEVFKETNKRSDLATCYFYLGRANLGLDHPNESLAPLQASAKLSEELGRKEMEACAYFEASKAYLRLNSFSQAEEYGNKALSAAEIYGNPELILSINSWLAIVKKEAGTAMDVKK